MNIFETICMILMIGCYITYFVALSNELITNKPSPPFIQPLVLIFAAGFWYGAMGLEGYQFKEWYRIGFWVPLIFGVLLFCIQFIGAEKKLYDEHKWFMEEEEYRARAKKNIPGLKEKYDKIVEVIPDHYDPGYDPLSAKT